MDPVASAVTAFLNAVQSAQALPELPAAPQTVLTTLLGQDVNLLFQGQTAAGLQFSLPSGQTVTAQGDFPYPEGTQLLVRVAASDGGGLRLQTLQALPPSPPAILAPLLQGEAQALQGRLTQADPPPELEPLVQLFRLLGGAQPGESVPVQPQAPAQTPTPAQTSTPPQAAVPGQPSTAGDLPAQAQVPAQPVPSSTQAPGSQPAPTGTAPQPGPAPDGTSASMPAAPGLPPEAPVPAQALPQGAPVPVPQETAVPARALPDPAAQTSPPAEVEDLTAMVQARLPQALSQDVLRAVLRDLPEPQAQALRALFRPGAAAPEAAVVQDAVQRVQASLVRRTDLPPGQGDAVTQLFRGLARAQDSAAPMQAPAAAPETWESWIKAGVKALADPSVSPREAPFHAAQAKEGTAFYELPLPWAPQSPLQMWVESDAKGKGRGDPGGASTRVLLGLSFSRLGETRLGIAKGPGGLQVRVWAQNPQTLLAAQTGMEEELKALGTPVDLKILPLNPGPGGVVPSIRSLAAGSTFQVLG